MTADELTALLTTIGMPASYIPITVLLFVALCGICAQLAAWLPQSTPTSSKWYFYFRMILNWLGGNYANAKNELNADKLKAAITLAEAKPVSGPQKS
jgi:hypothetical protein